jgi:hypothetical protein
VVLDLAGDDEGLVLLVGDVVDDQRDALPRLGPEVLRGPGAVLRDHGVRGGEDRRRRAVVPGQRDDDRVRVVGLEVEDVPDGRPAERVHALVGVADDHQVPVAAGQQLDQVVLGAVGVLVLVDHQVREPALPPRPDVRVVPEQLDGPDDEVVEVHRA